MPHNFPVIDGFEDGVATSVKSRDLIKSKTYQDSNKLFNTVKKDIDKLSKFDGQASWKGITIEPGETKQRVLDIIVPNTSLTNAQIDGLNRAIDYGNQKNIIINILVGGN